ncbi:hypothetical protein [Bradyrhizobium sp.]|jgi:hypothetical protein|uniref:hypothetical protein n=1 Tax=Bradyrhizobium sp. TaxID=376 RepID=UPI003C26DC62
MTDISSVASSAAAIVARPAAALKEAANATKTSFQGALAGVQSTLAVKPKTGFTSGPTYQAGTVTGQTKAAFNSTLSAAKSVLNIKP